MPTLAVEYATDADRLALVRAAGVPDFHHLAEHAGPLVELVALVDSPDGHEAWTAAGTPVPNGRTPRTIGTPAGDFPFAFPPAYRYARRQSSPQGGHA